MSKITAAVTSVFGYVPEDKLTNEDLEKIVDTNDEWVYTRTGIKERRILKEGTTSDMGAKILQGILDKRGISANEIDLVIVTTVTPDYVFPATANIICDKVGAKNAWGYDLSAACSGFIYGLTTGVQFITSGFHKKVVIISLDKMSSIINYEDRTTCILFGDGGGGVLLEPNAEGYGFQDAILRSDGSGRHYLGMPAGGAVKPASIETVTNKEHHIFQDGKTVFKFAVTHMAETAAELMEKHHLTADNIDWLVPHQANKRIIDATAQRCGIPAEKVFVNIERYGNTTNGTIPLCLWEMESKLKKGDKIIMPAFGGGFTWGAVYLTWAY